jgi:hypothetical protein
VQIINIFGGKESIDRRKAWEKVLLLRKPARRHMRVCGVMNQVGNSNFPPSGHLIFFLPTYTMKNKTREIQKKWPRARDRT